MNATQWIEILNANKFMRSDEEAMNFDLALAELALHPNREYLPALYLVLDDRCEQHEVMYGLIHFLESFELKDQLQAFIDANDRIIVNAKEWTMILLYGIINQDLARKLYSEMLHSTNSHNRDLCTKLLQEIAANESPPLSSRAESIISGATALDINIDEIQSDISSFLKHIQEGNILVLLQDDRPIAEIKPIK
ncbi:Imm30 family immunity protein [Microcoleus sp. ARI1-B5]|uniref:Imm30 family immunity protein n=1 Tax=unclassified Microcoleus TaxID=2642155 RepID=UPI002FCFDA1E